MSGGESAHHRDAASLQVRAYHGLCTVPFQVGAAIGEVTEYYPFAAVKNALQQQGVEMPVNVVVALFNFFQKQYYAYEDASRML